MAMFASVRLRSVAADERGAAMLEFALALPLLLALLLGIADCARLISYLGQADASAHAGASYARRYGWSPSGIEAAVTGASPLHAQATPAATLVTGCIVDRQLVGASGSTCPDGGPVGSFVVVNAQLPFQPLVPWPMDDASKSVSAHSMVQIR